VPGDLFRLRASVEPAFRALHSTVRRQKRPPMQILLEFSPALSKRDGFEALV
jgi:hypothetical protein